MVLVFPRVLFRPKVILTIFFFLSFRTKKKENKMILLLLLLKWIDGNCIEENGKRKKYYVQKPY